MKEQIFLIISLTLIMISCKSSKDNIQKTVIIDNFFRGDSIISDKVFIKTINSTCEISNYYEQTQEDFDNYEKKCSAFKINTYIDSTFFKQFPSYELKHKLTETLSLTIHKSIDSTREDINRKIILTIFKNSLKTDSLYIYRDYSFNPSNPLSIPINKNTYYFIDINFNIWLLDLLDNSETGITVQSWKKYKINSLTGKFKLIEELK